MNNDSAQASDSSVQARVRNVQSCQRLKTLLTALYRMEATYKDFIRV